MNKIILATAVAATVLMSGCKGGSSKGLDAPKPNFDTPADTVSYELGMTNAPSEAQLKMYLADPRTGSDSTYVEEFMKGLRDGLEAADDKERAAYLAGLQVGSQMGMSIKQVESMVFGNDSTKHLSRKNFLAGFIHALGGKKTALKVDGKLLDKEAATMDLQQRIQKMAADAAAKQYAKEIKAADAFIAAKAKEAGVKKLEGGTLYKVITEGNGAIPKAGERVNVIYEGRLTDGTVFDASSQHPGPDGKSFPMTVGRLVPGFNAALQAMPVGSTWEIYIPYDQGYNDQDLGEIKPFSPLIFTVTLVSIDDQQ